MYLARIFLFGISNLIKCIIAVEDGRTSVLLAHYTYDICLVMVLNFYQ